MKIFLPPAAVLMLLASWTRAAGPLEGVKTASEAAEFRTAGAELVEIEGFSDPEGDISCSGKSFSDTWHYKFYSPAYGGWLMINACGDNFVNAAKHFPYRKAEEPTKALPASFADSGAVLEKLDRDGVFQGTGGTRNREILMNIRYHPEKNGRPAGCYWTVSQGKQKVLTGCDGKKHWVAAAGGKPKLAPGKMLKGKDTAAKYAKLAAETVGRKYPGARMMYAESLADRTGSAKCLSPADGWTFVFSSRELKTSITFGGCRGKTSLEEVDFTGKTGNIRSLDPLPLQFKDSDFVLSQTPAACVHATVLMKLQNFKPEFTPFTGHNLLWTVDCGSLRYYLDGYTGKYLGPGKK